MELQKQKEKKEKQELEQKRLEMNDERSLLQAMKMSELGTEPESSAEGVCEISIRKLTGSGRFSRRFLKTNTVSQIKDYIDSLPHEDVGFEDDDEAVSLPEYKLML